MGIAAAAIAAGVIGAGATAYGASESSRSARRAARQNRRAAEDTNAMNYRMFQEGRGSEGNALFPLYFGDTERVMADDARRIYDATGAMMGSPAEQAQRAQDTMSRYRPSFDAGSRTVDRIFSGGLTDDRLGFAKPVQEARVRAAQTQQQSLREGLLERLNAIKSSDARKGFIGSSGAREGALLRETVGANQRAAGVMSAAELDNAMMEQAIREQGQQLQLSSLDLPYQRAQQDMAFQQMPADFMAQGFQRRMQPFDRFYMGPGTFRADQMPMVTPTPSTAQIVAGGIGQAANTAGNYFTTQALMNQMNQMNQANQPQPQPQPRQFTMNDYNRMYGVNGQGGVLGTFITNP